ncbi:MAG: DUF4147 domain-containing protein [Thermoplasmataceae archaeon]
MKITAGNLSDGRAVTLVNALTATLEKLTPEQAVARALEPIKNEISSYSRVFVIGFGKASFGMYCGLRRVADRSLAASAIIVPEYQHIENPFGELSVLRGTHPFPGESTQKSSQQVIDRIRGVRRDDLVIVLISGGSSSLFEIPVEGLSMDRLSSVTKCVMESGENISTLNSARKLMSRVKGGKLLDLLSPARSISLIISDVPGDDLSMVGSGPTVRDSGPDGKEKERIMDLICRCDPSAKEAVAKAATAKRVETSAAATNMLILRNQDFVDGMCAELLKTGEKVVSMRSGITGDVEELSGRILKTLRERYSREKIGFWFVMGGESTSKVVGEGRGGRNQELAARVALKMLPGEDCVFMSAGTDGIDGNSDAMGAVVYPGVFMDVQPGEVQSSLKRSDIGTLLGNIGSALFSGPTGNNVSDIMAGFYGGIREDS